MDKPYPAASLIFCDDMVIMAMTMAMAIMIMMVMIIMTSFVVRLVKSMDVYKKRSMITKDCLFIMEWNDALYFGCLYNSCIVLFVTSEIQRIIPLHYQKIYFSLVEYRW